MYASTPDRIDAICFCSLIIDTQLILNDLGKNRNYDSGSMDMKENLPKGWVKTKIELICDLIGGGTPSRKNLEYFKDGQIIWLTPTEINKEKILKINSSKENITELGLTKSSAKLIPRNAVLLTSRASIGYVAIAETTVTTNQGICFIHML